MAQPRLDLHAELATILETNNVYFQPPASVKLQYPAIIYKLVAFDIKQADNIRYSKLKKYELNLITRDPDNTITESLLDLPLCRFDRRFSTEGLTHDVFSIFF